MRAPLPLLTLLAALRDRRLAGLDGRPTDEWDALVAQLCRQARQPRTTA